ncbi:histidine phosphatase family protein [Ottowia pentelensis]|uniref:Histidine phosphatase family protein n=1 Tax=Ottowia pentelensis TaxID=511108 RepID=A0ABV6PXS0_9BURK
MTHKKSSRQPPVPQGYTTWLDYAVLAFSGRAAWNEFILDDDWSDTPTDVFYDLVQEEYCRLKERQPLRTLMLVRHGQSLANAGGVTMEHHAIPLTELGRRQTELLAECLPAKPAMICSSPFLRARQSAEPYCVRTGLADQVIDQLHEFDTIDPELFQGMTGGERRPIMDAYWAEGDPDKRMGPRAETFREFAQRVECFRTGAMLSLPDGAVLFGHGMWIGMLTWQLMGFSAGDSLGMKAFRRFQQGLPMPNAAVYRFTEAAPGRWTFAAEEAIMRAVSTVAVGSVKYSELSDTNREEFRAE